jgi:hypothetical protein
MFSDRVLKPAIAAIANKIDRDGLVMAKNNTANIVGTAGTPPSSLLTFLNAGAYLDAEGAPRDGQRSCIIEPFTSATIVDGLKGLFVPNNTITKQFQKGMMGTDSAGMDWRMDQNVVNQTFGSYATTTAFSCNTSTATGFLTTGWASTSTIALSCSTAVAALKQGDVIQIANVYAVNPQNRQAYGSNKLRNFVIQADVTVATSGTTSVIVSPAVITAGQFQNVSVTSPGASTVTPFNNTGIVSPQNIVMHKNAFTMACADLELPDGVHFAGRASDKQLGLSIRVVRQYTINNDSIPTRLDVLYGWAPLYPELACRVAA